MGKLRNKTQRSPDCEAYKFKLLLQEPSIKRLNQPQLGDYEKLILPCKGIDE
jgi:hypothetical protein